MDFGSLSLVWLSGQAVVVTGNRGIGPCSYYILICIAIPLSVYLCPAIFTLQPLEAEDVMLTV